MSNPSNPKFLDQVRAVMRLQCLSLATERSYVQWIKRFIIFHRMRHPLDMGAAEICEFLTHLAVDREVASSTQNQALYALLFLYDRVLQKDIGRISQFERAMIAQRLPEVFWMRFDLDDNHHPFLTRKDEISRKDAKTQRAVRERERPELR
ncbi:MAG: phage integrase N-terminal SAM-like domain-containing protein [Blastocatellia bacterium]|nr:phage integrase N-terminal SAM-like domain-containing protein [Blastocatellia bacterium]